jgi:hypothetical protein
VVVTVSSEVHAYLVDVTHDLRREIGVVGEEGVAESDEVPFGVLGQNK